MYVNAFLPDALVSTHRRNLPGCGVLMQGRVVQGGAGWCVDVNAMRNLVTNARAHTPCHHDMKKIIIMAQLTKSLETTLRGAS